MERAALSERHGFARAVGVGFVRDDQIGLRALRLVSLFEFGERGVNVSFALHFKDVAQARACSAFPPHNVVVFVFQLRVVAEHAANIGDHALHVRVREAFERSRRSLKRKS